MTETYPERQRGRAPRQEEAILSCEGLILSYAYSYKIREGEIGECSYFGTVGVEE